MLSFKKGDFMKKIKVLFFCLVIVLSIIFIGKGITTHAFTKVFGNMFESNNNYMIEELYNGVSSSNSSQLEINTKPTPDVINVVKNVDQEEDNSSLPVVYIYNTHQKEEYALSSSSPYSIKPTVYTASYILKSELGSVGISSIVEDRDVIKTLKELKQDYPYTYVITEGYLHEVKEKYKSLKYFIDLHRDGAAKSVTTIEINGKSYAKMMFVLGGNRNNYDENIKKVNTIREYLDKNYPGLLRNNYFVKEYNYNQSIDNGVFLIEVGAQENTLSEIYNSLKALSLAFKYLEENDE